MVQFCTVGGMMGPSQGGFVGPLDGLSVAPTLAYSFRRLLSTYTGPLIRLRRSSDNAEQDIGYVGNGALDTAAASSFLGASSGFIAKVYDQSGNSYDLVQSTASRQPAYSASLINSKPAADFDGTDDYLEANVTGLSLTSFQISGPAVVHDLTLGPSSNPRGLWIATVKGATNDWGNEDSFATAVDSSFKYSMARVVGTDGLDVRAGTPDTSLHLIGHVFNSGVGRVRLDKAEIGSDTYSDTNSIDPVSFIVGARWLGSLKDHGQLDISEIVFFASALSTADQSALENNQQSYWGTP